MEIKFLDSTIEAHGFKPATSLSAGYDLRAVLDSELIIEPGDTAKIHTGIALHMGSVINEDDGTEYIPCAMVLPRSGLGCKGIRPRNAPGLIDADYQGEIIICLYNDSEIDYTVRPYDRIAQLVFMFATHPEFIKVANFSNESERGASGFGSTGTV